MDLVHTHARSKHPAYPERCFVPDEKVPWNVDWPDYQPTEFEHKVVTDNDRTKKPGGWADPKDHTTIDFSARRSYAYGDGGLGVSQEGRPLNPKGRTGMSGRGLLGKWGPNHAADPIVTRYAEVDGKQAIQMVAIKRKDIGSWAIPGGMVDDGETVSVTLRREFQEEAGNLSDPEQRKRFQELMDLLFDPKNGRFVYKGYVDDPRNTDNSWMETWAVHYHCTHELGNMINLNAGDDAAEVQWLTVKAGCPYFETLYANHKSMVLQAIKQMESGRAEKVAAYAQSMEWRLRWLSSYRLLYLFFSDPGDEDFEAAQQVIRFAAANLKGLSQAVCQEKINLWWDKACFSADANNEKKMDGGWCLAAVVNVPEEHITSTPTPTQSVGSQFEDIEPSMCKIPSNYKTISGSSLTEFESAHAEPPSVCTKVTQLGLMIDQFSTKHGIIKAN